MKVGKDHLWTLDQIGNQHGEDRTHPPAFVSASWSAVSGGSELRDWQDMCCCKNLMTPGRERAVQCVSCSRPQVPTGPRAWKQQEPQGSSPVTSSSSPVQKAPRVPVPGKQSFSRLRKEKLEFYT